MTECGHSGKDFSSFLFSARGVGSFRYGIMRMDSTVPYNEIAVNTTSLDFVYSENYESPSKLI